MADIVVLSLQLSLGGISAKGVLGRAEKNNVVVIQMLIIADRTSVLI